mmetsp:Transcript_56856/g.151275  ORF Transcript_56856/g.151275 Transcript_56856/m.151275 type:complete len:213 (+) Transcript_56856:1-639(+)
MLVCWCRRGGNAARRATHVFAGCSSAAAGTAAGGAAAAAGAPSGAAEPPCCGGRPWGSSGLGYRLAPSGCGAAMKPPACQLPAATGVYCPSEAWLPLTTHTWWYTTAPLGGPWPCTSRWGRTPPAAGGATAAREEAEPTTVLAARAAAAGAGSASWRSRPDAVPSAPAARSSCSRRDWAPSAPEARPPLSSLPDASSSPTPFVTAGCWGSPR